MVLISKKKYQIIVIIVLLFIFALGIYLFYATNYLDNNHRVNEKYSVLINNNKISIEVAATPSQQYRGLSNRESLCADCGMLFVFRDKTEQIFVMRNMKFPLDIVFIEDDKIINIESNLSPEGESPKHEYRSLAPANRVLELPGGYATRNNIKVGDTLIITEN